MVLFLSDFNARFNAADCQRKGSRNSHNGSTSAVNTVSFQTIPIFEKYHMFAHQIKITHRKIEDYRNGGLKKHPLV